MPISETYNMDCMDGMAQFPDKFFELALVDPPYGIGDKKLTGGGTWAAKYKAGDCAWDVAPNQDYFTELFRVSQNQIIWGANYFNLGPTRGFIIWDKVAQIPTMADCEFAWTSFDCNAKIYRHVRNTSEARIHPTQKPVALYRWLLQHYAKPGDKILDTHLGSGSSRIAAWDLGFDFYATELDADYFREGNERFERHRAQGTLFAPEPITAEQAQLFETR